MLYFSYIGSFQKILKVSSEHSFKNNFFYRTPPVATFETEHILQLPIYFILGNKFSIGMRAIWKKLNIFMLQLPIYYRLEYLYWCKCRHCKNEARKIDCLCCRDVDLTHIALAKIPEREGSISPCSCYGWLPKLLVTHVRFIYIVDEFFFLFLV